MVQNVIILILCLVIAFWSPVLLYAAFKLLPHAYNGLNKAVRSIHRRAFQKIDEWDLYWDQSPEDRKAWSEAMRRFKEKERV